MNDHPQPPRRTGASFLLTSALFAFVALAFIASPLTQVGDSRFTLVVSENLLAGRGLSLDDQFKGRAVSDSLPYQVVAARGHLYYYFPPGSSLLSLPFVGLANILGIHAVNSNLSYNLPVEVRMQRVLAAFLMAAMACVFLRMALLLLPTSVSLLITLLAVFGSQVWSTASRALWSDTWGLLLLSIALFMILRSRVRHHSIQPEILGTLAAWMYMIRPTYSVAIVALTGMVFVVDRKHFLRYCLAGVSWGALFLVTSTELYGTMLPAYYAADRLSVSYFVQGFAGNLVSPSRGLLVYVPSTIIVFGLLAMKWRTLREKDLVLCAIVGVVLLLMVVAAFPKWWGGHCYGARLTTGVVPWLFLLAILSLRAMPNESLRRIFPATWKARLLTTVVMFLLALSVAINGRGAVSEETHQWNTNPENIDQHTNRLWDWSRAQFLAGL